jgi:hypothetical protein
MLSPWVVSGIFVILTFIFHSSILFGSSHLWEDFVEQEFPFRNLAASSLAQGILPHWDPYIFAGMPFMADIQTAFWYPTNLLQTLFVSDGHLSAGVMEWFILIHYAIAGLGMYWFVRKVIGLDDWSSLFAGITYAFSGFIVAQAIHQMIVYHIALFPWIAFLFVRGLSNWKYALGAGLLLGVMYLAGHPQSTLYLTFTLGVIAVYELVKRSKKEEGRSSMDIGMLLRAAIPVMIGLGVFAIQFLPSNELASLSRREVMTYEKSVDGSIGYGNLLTLVLPRLFGVTDGAKLAKVPYWNGPYYLSWETAMYIGILPLFFGLVAAFAIKRNRFVPLFAGLALFSVLFALGDHFVLYRIFFLFPLFNKLRTPARMVIVFAFAMSVLGALGMSKFLAAELRAKKNMVLGIAGAILLIWLLPLIGVVNAKTFLSTAPDEAQGSMSWATSLAAIPVLAMFALVLLWYFDKLRGNALVFGSVAVTVFELFNYGMGLNSSPEDPAAIFGQQKDLITTLKNDQNKEITRARTRDGHAMLVERNDGAYDRIQLMEGYNPLVLQRVAPETANPDEQADLMNIKWSIFRDEKGQPNFGERHDYLPRVLMYYKVDVRSDSLGKEELKTNPNYDYRNTLLLEEKPKLEMGAFDPHYLIKIKKYSQNEITTTVHTASNGMLWFSEVYYPAWKAYVDDKPAKIYRAFTSLRAVEVPAGDHQVVLRYESDAFATGSTITIATLLLTIAGFVATFVIGKKNPVTASQSEPEHDKTEPDEFGSEEDVA